MAELLLKSGLNYSIQNNEGMTAFGRFFEKGIFKQYGTNMQLIN